MENDNAEVLRFLPPEWEVVNDGPSREVLCRKDGSEDECGVFPDAISAVNHARWLVELPPVEDGGKQG